MLAHKLSSSIQSLISVDPLDIDSEKSQESQGVLQLGFSPEQIRVLLKAETSCGLPSVFYIHISVSHKSLIQVLNPISFILARLWPNLCGSLVQRPPCLFGAEQ